MKVLIWKPFHWTFATSDHNSRCFSSFSFLLGSALGPRDVCISAPLVIAWNWGDEWAVQYGLQRYISPKIATESTRLCGLRWHFVICITVQEFKQCKEFHPLGTWHDGDFQYIYIYIFVCSLLVRIAFSLTLCKPLKTCLGLSALNHGFIIA